MSWRTMGSPSRN